jgi:hypothetical protein
MLNLFRNLNLAKRDPKSFAWSLWKGSERSPGKLDHHASGAVVLANVTTCYSASAIAKMQHPTKYRKKDGGIRRTVFAWLRGTVSTQAVTKGRALSLNPCTDEWSFVYADTREPCPTQFAFVIADSTGCYEAIAI